jgi:hypothetical protein
VTGRESVFSDPRIIAAIKQHFVPVADNCSPLQTRRDEEGKFFRLIAEQGHYAGRTRPTTTRQGLYVATSEGKLLASVNSTSADRVLEMIQRAITAGKLHPSNTGGAEQPAVTAASGSLHRNYPENGLVLKMYVRDLARENPNWRNTRMNFDYVWITKDEVKQFVPAGVRVGDQIPVATNIVTRLARCHLADTVRGECPPWNQTHIKASDLHLVVESVKDDLVRLRLEGHIRLVAPPSNEVNPYSKKAIDKERGIDARLLGYLTYDRKKEAFGQVRMIAVGPRWGASVYNGRANDPGPAPIGFAFEIARDDRAVDRTPPMALRSDYFAR